MAAVAAVFVPGTAAHLPAQDMTPERVIVLAERTTVTPAESGAQQFEVDRATLEESPALRLDDVLREQVPGFSLFRRSSSRVANPTTQGVSLRNVGPNGAGRTLVLLDGVPQNDPFGGWVYWSRLPTTAIDNVRVVEGGGAGLFGSAALGGTIELRGRRGADNEFSLEAEGGSADTYEVDVAGRRSFAEGAVTVFGRVDRFATGGYRVVRADTRGPVDTDADARAQLVDAGLTWAIGSSNFLSLRGSGLQEDRGNGTPLTTNSTDAADFSATFSGEVPATKIDYQVLAYGQLREFRSTFSSVNLTRTVETPSLDQFSVPAYAVGGSVTINAPLFSTHNLLAGIDARWVEGDSRELFRYMGSAFTRDRDAGGEQTFVGGFLEDTWRPAAGTTLSASGRVDYYANAEGFRQENDIASGASLRDESFGRRDGWVANGSVGISQQVWPDWLRVRAAAYTGFRVPTLNELYRPFRVGNDITEANATLRPERLYGAEFGLESHPVETLDLSLGGYYNEVHHAVANVTVAKGPVTVDPFGFIPAGGTGELRENLGRTAVYGLEAGLSWTPRPAWRFSLNYLYSHAAVESAPTQPGLEGKRLAQAPEQQGIIGVHWNPWKPLGLTCQTRLVGGQFEDDENTLRLAPYATVDVQASLQISAHLQGWVGIENVFDNRYEAGKSVSGVVTIGAPRLVNIGLRLSY